MRGAFQRVEEPTAVLLGSDPEYLINFRGELISELCSRGYRVVTGAWPGSPAIADQLAKLGVVRHVELPVRQGTLNPLHELRLISSIYALLREEQPRLVIAYTAKPVVAGMLAGRMAQIPKRAALVEGLGYAFTDGREVKRRLARTLLKAAYRVALRSASTVVVLNEDDRRRISHIAKMPGEGIKLLPGIGVSDRYYNACSAPALPLKFIYVGRVLIDKGLRELLEAGRRLRVEGHEFDLQVVGPYDENPAAIPRGEFDALLRAAGAQWLGPSAEVPALLRGSHVLVLPSYREGFPRVVMEAMAASRPVIAANVPGCRDAVCHGETGLLVPPRDAQALADAMRRFLMEPALSAKMGAAAYYHAVGAFRAVDRARDLLDFVGAVRSRAGEEQRRGSE